MNELDWICDVCDRLVEDDTGYVTVDLGAVHEYERARREWEARVRAKMSPEWREGGGLLVAGVDLVEHPRAVPWRVLHAACDPTPDSNDYWIAVERIGDAAAVIGWAAHLSEKNWIGATTWTDVLRRCEAQLRGGPVGMVTR